MSAARQGAKLLFGQLRLEPASPAIYLGLRGALAIWIPIFTGMIAQNLLAGILAAFAAFIVIGADAGGAYRSKAVALVSATLANAVAIYIATFVNPSPGLRILAIFIWVFGSGLASIYGNAASIVAFNAAVVFATSVEIPNPPDAWQRVAIYLAGGSWALLLSLGLWPLRSNGPIFDAVKELYERLARMMELIAIEVGEAKPVVTGEKMNQAYDATIAQVDQARLLWTTIRASRSGQSRRTNQMLILLETGAQLSNKILTLGEILNLVASDPGFDRLQEVIGHGARQLRNGMHLLALVIEKRGESIHLASLLQGLGSLVTKLRGFREGIQPGEYSNPENVRRLLSQVESLVEKLQFIARIAAGLESGPQTAEITPIVPRDSSPLIATLIENLNFNSVAFRHALRLALVAALAVALNQVQHLPRGYWSVLTALVVLKPNFGGTFATAVQRISGTLLGGLIAAILGSFIHNQSILLFCAGLFAFFAFAFRPFNYSLFVIGLTPMVILILNIDDVGDWHVAMLRILETLLGGGLALLGGFALFPMWERRKLPTQLAETLKFNLQYFQQVITTVLERSWPGGRQSPEAQTLQRICQQAALENSNMMAVIQRALVEPNRFLKDIEPAMVVGVYTRAFFAVVTTLVDHISEFQNPRLAFVLEGLGDSISYVMNNLILVLEGKQPLRPLPELEDGLLLFRYTENLDSIPESQRPLAYLALERIVEGIKAMHSAVARLPVGSG